MNLSNITTAVRTELAKANTAGNQMIKHYIEAGNLLQEAKESCGHGKWERYLENEIGIKPRTAQRYMRLAANTSRVSHLESLTEALAIIAEPRVSMPSPGKAARGYMSDGSEIFLNPSAINPGFTFYTFMFAADGGSDLEAGIRSMKNTALSEHLNTVIGERSVTWTEHDCAAWNRNHFIEVSEALDGEVA
ncbi:MAG: DUF3102 domain-containing protein [bacterium]